MSVPAIHSNRIVNSGSLPFFPDKLENLDEKEELTRLTWRELFDRAVSRPVPAYVIAIARLQPLPGENQPRYKIYDGLALRNTPNQNGIKEIHYFAIPCFAFKNGQMVACPLGSEPFRPFLPSITGEKRRIQKIVRTYFPRKSAFPADEKSYHEALQHSMESVASKGLVRNVKIRPSIDKIRLYALDGANFHCKDRTALGQCQFIVGNAWNKLLSSDQATVWTGCAEKNMPALNRAGESISGKRVSVHNP